MRVIKSNPILTMEESPPSIKKIKTTNSNLSVDKRYSYDYTVYIEHTQYAQYTRQSLNTSTKVVPEFVKLVVHLL